MARSFNGTSDLITVDGASDLFPADTSPFSLSIWIKATAATSKCMFSIGRDISANGQLAIYSASSVGAAIRVVMVDNAGTTRMDSTGTKTALDGTWHHVLITLNSSRALARYIDGVADTSSSYTTGTFSLPRAAIGCLRRNTNGFFFPGTIGAVAGWRRTLAAKEAVALASGLPASRLVPAHYWPLWGVDSPEPDIGNG